jgi:DNA repair photolyase
MPENDQNYLKGRGAQHNPKNRFDTRHYESWEHQDEEESLEGRTRFISVFPKSIVNKVTSPDVGMDYSLNPYQGCEHGCTYCFARPTHEYWGYSAGVDFEKVILVKENAPELLRATLRKKSWQVKPIVMSGNTDCYQPCEREYGITRKLLEVFLEYRHPVGILSKNTIMERDLDLIRALNELQLISINLSITTLNEDLRRKLEPRTASLPKKLRLIENFAKEGIAVNVLMAPIIPSLNDHEIFPMARTLADAGAVDMHSIIARFNGPNQAIFMRWLDLNYPDRKDKILNLLAEMHGGDIGDSRIGTRMTGEGVYALNLKRQIALARARYFPTRTARNLRTDLFRIPDSKGQLNLFEE